MRREEAIELQENPHAYDNLSSFLANAFINKHKVLHSKISKNYITNIWTYSNSHTHNMCMSTYSTNAWIVLKDFLYWSSFVILWCRRRSYGPILYFCAKKLRNIIILLGKLLPRGLIYFTREMYWKKMECNFRDQINHSQKFWVKTNFNTYE